MSDENSAPGRAIGKSTQHAEVLRKEGTWKVKCTYYMGGEADPIVVDGTEQGEMLGELWCVSRFEADVMGSMLHGNASLGYDPSKEKYVSTWKDSSIPFLYTFDGEFDGDSGVLSMMGENFDPVRQCLAIYRSVVTFVSDKEHSLELTIDVPDGLPIKVLTYEYKRA